MDIVEYMDQLVLTMMDIHDKECITHSQGDLQCVIQISVYITINGMNKNTNHKL